MPSNIAKGIAPISAAAIWTIGGNYLPVEWTVLLVSLVSAVAFSSEHAAMQIRIADEADLSTIKSLLGTNDLPVADISKALIAGFLVAEDASGLVIGIGGLEQLGSSVLLRSLAVAPEARGLGIASALVARLEDNARACGRQDVWLLTTTAERFFERVGYKSVSREEVHREVRLSRQFAALCPSTASCMRKRLRTATSAPIAERPLSN
jgi:amino-acid N-acetyltransferase